MNFITPCGRTAMILGSSLVMNSPSALDLAMA
eukprot:CAMPEP_0180805238 /NCGR_PEP_ID=MMETSP1038_2-20121128/61906_1 /TAXON_ID=632150 /ORGANISM="Azadinium spinosum, Strain 3D9" /LENGTH=31 /DNA_ID= /DNA_START= /DNA_END= /DNA_ORIENTATION=